MYRPTRNLAKHSARLAKAAASGERVLEILDAKPEIRDADHAVEAPKFVGDWSFQIQVKFLFPKGP
jgi:ATP-binding cassette subfamily B protein